MPKPTRPRGEPRDPRDPSPADEGPVALPEPLAAGDLREAKQAWSARLLGVRPAAPDEGFGLAAPSRRGAAPAPTRNQNVVGVGIGDKVSEGLPAGTLAVKFLVRTKFPRGMVPPEELLPATIDGLPVDVEEVGTLRALATRRGARPPAAYTPETSRPAASAASASAQAATDAPAPIPNPRLRHRPLFPGLSVGYVPVGGGTMAGTLGVFVKDRTGKRYILSNNHVLADEGRLPVGGAIYQQGLLDGGRALSANQVATLTRFIPFDPAGNAVDAAIARLVPNIVVGRAIPGIGTPLGASDPRLDDVVAKYGRTTAFTKGLITSVDTDVNVAYDTGTFLFQEQVIVRGANGQPFSKAGDSGSLIVRTTDRRAVALLFAGSSVVSIASPIRRVLSALRVSLL